MWSRKLLAAALLAGGVYGCTDRTVPTAPGGGTAAAAVDPSRLLHEGRMQRLAQRFALALADPAFRARIRAGLDRSFHPEKKLHFQGLLTDSNRAVLRAVAGLARTTEEAIQDDAANAVGLEIYLPVARHRASWKGDASILVATVLGDEDRPVAYDTRGNRHLLDRNRPPDTPVLALVPLETDFSRFRSGPGRAECTIETCPPTGGGGGGGGGTPPGTPPPPGLYMTYSHVSQSFESWLKGNPEFEVHVLGQHAQTDSLKSYQCAGEHAGGPYSFDQNGLDWTGNVLLMSQTQLNSYKAQHPGQSVRVFLVEDDDTACDIRTGNDIFEAILAAVDAAYQAYTGGRDSLIGITRFFRRAQAVQKVLQKLAQLIKTNDELVGNAVEDVVVGQFYPGANWIVKGQNNVTTGWIKLVMR
jgi:hypothetical protein